MMEVSAKAHHSALWWPVLISGIAYVTGLLAFIPSLLRRASACAFTTTARALIRLAYASGSARGLYDGPLIANALACFVPYFPGCHRVSLDSVNLYN